MTTHFLHILINIVDELAVNDMISTVDDVKLFMCLANLFRKAFVFIHSQTCLHLTNKVGLMHKLVYVILFGLFIAGCNDNYVSKKRDGLRPYPAEEDSRQAQEAEE